jgi:hypothetical protein
MVDRLAPRVRPNRRAVAFQGWRDMLFLHWPVPAPLMRGLVPPTLGLDLFEGLAWVTLLPFRAVRSRPWGVPGPLGFGFFEVNLRTYVVHRGEPGIWFFSLDATSRFVVRMARAVFGLPYVHARIHHTIDGPVLGYRCERDTGEHLAVRSTVGGGRERAADGALAFFLLERYVLFAQRRNALVREQIHHAPYAYASASVDALDENLVAAAHIPASARGELLAHRSPGVDVAFYAPERIPTRPMLPDLGVRTPVR